MQERIADSLTAKIRERMNNLRVGAPLDKGIDVGAIVAPMQLERIEALVAQRRRGRRELLAAQDARCHAMDCFFLRRC